VPSCTTCMFLCCWTTCIALWCCNIAPCPVQNKELNTDAPQVTQSFCSWRFCKTRISHKSKLLLLYTYVHTYVCVFVCVCVFWEKLKY
jgi:hypothetical protein